MKLIQKLRGLIPDRLRAHPNAQAGGTPKAGSMAAPQAYLLASSDGAHTVAFGLRWRTLVRSGARETAIKTAKTGKATHLVLLGQQVGYADLGKNPPAANLHAASVLAAKTQLASAIFCLRLDDEYFWIALTRNGQPSSIDEIRRGDEPAAHDAIRELLHAHESEDIAVLSDLTNPGPNSARFSLMDLFDGVRHANGSEALVALPKGTAAIPKPVMAMVVLAGAGMLAKSLWDDHVAAKEALERAAGINQELDPRTAWQPVIDKWLADNPTPDHGPLLSARRSIADLPVAWHGWWLTGVRCQAGQMAQNLLTWTCSANYKRTPAGVTSTAMGEAVQKKMPSAAIAFPTLGSMMVNWSLQPAAARSVNLADLSLPEPQTVAMASAIQPVLAALAQVPELKMAVVEMQPPRKSDGTAHPKPEGMTEIYAAPINLKGPLRSLDYALTKLPPVDWTAFGVLFDERIEGNSKGLIGSAFAAEFEGRVLAAKPGTTP